MPSNRCSIAHWEWDMRSSFFICICIYFWHMPNSWISRFIVVQHTTILCCCWCLILKVPGEANIIPSYMYLLLVVGVCVLYTTYMHNYWCIELSRSRIKNKFCVLFFDFYFILFLHNISPLESFTIIKGAVVPKFWRRIGSHHEYNGRYLFRWPISNNGSEEICNGEHLAIRDAAILHGRQYKCTRNTSDWQQQPSGQFDQCTTHDKRCANRWQKQWFINSNIIPASSNAYEWIYAWCSSGWYECHRTNIVPIESEPQSNS